MLAEGFVKCCSLPKTVLAFYCSHPTVFIINIIILLSCLSSWLGNALFSIFFKATGPKPYSFPLLDLFLVFIFFFSLLVPILSITPLSLNVLQEMELWKSTLSSSRGGATSTSWEEFLGSWASIAPSSHLEISRRRHCPTVAPTTLRASMGNVKFAGESW